MEAMQTAIQTNIKKNKACFNIKKGKPADKTIIMLKIKISLVFGGIILFFIVVLIFSVLKRIIHPLDKVNKLLNQVLGGVAGTIQVLFFISAVFLLLKMFNIPDKADKDKSLMYNKVSLIVPSSVRFVMGNNNSLQDYMQKIIQTNTSTIDN